MNGVILLDYYSQQTFMTLLTVRNTGTNIMETLLGLGYANG